MAPCFLAAELLRTTDIRHATMLAWGGWALVGFFALASVAVRGGWRGALRLAARAGALASVSCAVFVVYHTRAGLTRAGVHVDAAYTFLGLSWALELKNPITFAGATPSYPQFPFMLLGHLPGALFGVGRLGELAVHFGLMTQVAAIIAAATLTFVRGSLWRQAAIAALAAGVYANRLGLQTFNMVGYAIPAVALGFMLVAAIYAPDTRRTDRFVGGLLTFALLHYYTAFAFVLPVASLWLVARRRPTARVFRFLGDNPWLVPVLVVAIATLSVHPELLLRRVADVSTPGAAGFSLGAIPAKIRSNWAPLQGYPRFIRWLLWEGTAGTWYLVGVPPIGGWVSASLGVSWLAGLWCARGRRLRYIGLWVVFLVTVVTLSSVQHLLTDMMEYRDLTAVIATVVAAGGFVFFVDRRRWLPLAAAVGIAIFNFVDVGVLQGAVHGTPDYPYRSTQTFEALGTVAASLTREPGATPTTYVLTDRFFPLRDMHVGALAARGFPVQTVDGDAAGTSLLATLIRAFGECEDSIVVTHRAFLGSLPPGCPLSDDGAVQAFLVHGRCLKDCAATSADLLAELGRYPVARCDVLLRSARPSAAIPALVARSAAG